MPVYGIRRWPAMLLALACVGAVASVPISVGREALYDTVLYPINAVALSVAGALIVSHQRTNPVGWVLAVMGVSAAWVEFAEGYGYHRGWPGLVPVEWLNSWMTMLGIGGTAVVLTLFPDGRGFSRGRRVLVWAAVVATALMTVGAAFGHVSDALYGSGGNPYAIAGMDSAYLLGQVVFSVTLVAAIIVLVIRFIRSAGIERQQLTWVAYAVSLLAVVGPVAVFWYDDSVLVRIAIAVVINGLPVTICIAILRYRLYDIDTIINRTLVYGVLTVLLAAAYLATALILGAVLGRADSPWVTAGATLAAAAGFRPLRARIQDVVDRQFRRARYEAFARIDAFLDDLRAGRANPEGLEGLLREVTAIPDVELRYVLPEETSPDPDPDVDPSGRVRRVVERADVPLAVLTYSGVPDDASRLLATVVERAGLAVEIGRLRAEVHRQLTEVEASRARIVAAGYEERRRLERDLHDGAQQRLVTAGLLMRHIQFALGESPVARDIDAAVDELTVAIAELRELANGVRPAYLDDGLAIALRALADRTPLPVTVRACADRFPTDIESTAYFVASEALVNAVKHSTAHGIEIVAAHRGGHLVLAVRDDGVGGAQPGNGSGLRGLADRVAAHGGRFRIDSPAGAGTTLTAELPCAS